MNNRKTQSHENQRHNKHNQSLLFLWIEKGDFLSKISKQTSFFPFFFLQELKYCSELELKVWFSCTNFWLFFINVVYLRGTQTHKVWTLVVHLHYGRPSVILLCDTKLRKNKALFPVPMETIQASLMLLWCLSFFLASSIIAAQKNIALCKIYRVFSWDSSIVFILPSPSHDKCHQSAWRPAELKSSRCWNCSQKNLIYALMCCLVLYIHLEQQHKEYLHLQTTLHRQKSQIFMITTCDNYCSAVWILELTTQHPLRLHSTTQINTVSQQYVKVLVGRHFGI